MTNKSDDVTGRAGGAQTGSEGATGATELSGRIEQDPDQGADMSDTGGSQWDSVIRAGGIGNEPGLEGLAQDTGDAGS